MLVSQYKSPESVDPRVGYSTLPQRRERRKQLFYSLRTIACCLSMVDSRGPMNIFSVDISTYRRVAEDQSRTFVLPVRGSSGVSKCDLGWGT